MALSPYGNLINEPREFAIEELFFSTTDRKGRIRRANRVFERISCFKWNELENRPHNIIRHPDMPRAIFQLFWEYLHRGQPIVAYVKNLAKDGRYYWVVALAAPAGDGYVSVRFKPSSPLFETVKNLYSELRSLEAGIENDSNDRKAAMLESRKLLSTKLQALGFDDYSVFMETILKQEMRSREAKLRHEERPRPEFSSVYAGHASIGFEAIQNTARALDQLLDILKILFRDLELYVEINEGVRSKSEILTDIAESLRVSALNGAIEADRLGSGAVGLRPVLDWLRTFSGEITQGGARLSTALLDLIKEVDRVVFGLTAAKLQIEMTATFAHELEELAIAGHLDEQDPMIQGAISCLHVSSCETLRRAMGNLHAVKGKLKDLSDSQMKLLESSRFLRPLYLTGKIEMADGAGPKLERVFREVSEQLNETIVNLNGLKNLLLDLDSNLIRGLGHGRKVDEVIAAIDTQLATV
jgi:aerotaxis receptor